MALTDLERKELMETLERTGGMRETALAQRNIPEEYRTYLSHCVHRELTLELDGLAPVRVIVTAPCKKQEQMPLHINFHGGGFIFMQDKDDDMYCAHLAAETGAVVVDVDYASSKDYPYPMAFRQSYAVAKWASEHCGEWGCDPTRLSLGGASAGGNLAMAVAMKAGETGDFRPYLLVLDYAATDNAMALEEPVQERSRAFSLLYTDGDASLLKNPYVSPCFADENHLRSLPKTLFIAPAKCPFYEPNKKLALRMMDAGVEVTVKAYPSSTHGFTVRMSGDWQDAQQVIIRALRET